MYIATGKRIFAISGSSYTKETAHFQMKNNDKSLLRASISRSFIAF